MGGGLLRRLLEYMRSWPFAKTLKIHRLPRSSKFQTFYRWLLEFFEIFTESGALIDEKRSRLEPKRRHSWEIFLEKNSPAKTLAYLAGEPQLSLNGYWQETKKIFTLIDNNIQVRGWAVIAHKVRKVREQLSQTYCYFLLNSLGLLHSML